MHIRRGDHGEKEFTVLLKIYIGVFRSAEPMCFDEVVSEIDGCKDDAEEIRPLATNLRKGFSNYNIFHQNGNMCMCFGTHK